jgi:hypothetical protein
MNIVGYETRNPAVYEPPVWTSFQRGGEQYMAEQASAQKPPPTRSGIPSNTIFVGQKPLVSYVTAIVMQFNSGSKELAVRAREE